MKEEREEKDRREEKKRSEGEREKEKRMMKMFFFFRSILSDPLRRNSHVTPHERHCSGVSFNTVQLHR